ncbi:putative F-box domain, leucine-rich repeat domain superfamily, F-box-like domain superfamily [Helianthus annuus]|nr:putative F-box domain, leucine-rich repeat domain superfamily, F-box-like domain superfamily [Helianthus annuus]
MKGNQHDYNPDDVVSRMPDDILITILSYLTVKEAAVTSHLSKRWRHLWRRTVHLDFEDNERKEQILLQPKLRLPARNRYINWVNRVMCHHNSPMIENFVISFNLDKQSKGAITKWIEFAMSKNVQNLELNLMEDEDGFSDDVRNFVFPIKIFIKKTRLSCRQHSMNVPPMPFTMVREIKFLKTLILKCVNINDETIGEMMKSCQVLEHLHIHNSGHLVNLIIRGPALALRKLEIRQCLGLQSIEIRDSNLALFEYLGSGIPLTLNNNPSLETVYLGAGYSGIENNLFQQISGCLPYLRNLRLNIYRPKVNLLTFQRYMFPLFPITNFLTMLPYCSRIICTFFLSLRCLK